MAQLQLITRVLDPVSRDWVMERGERLLDSTARSQVLILVALEYNSSPAFPGLGSKYHLIPKITDDLDVQLDQETTRCLAPLVDEQVISGVSTVTTVTEQPGAETLVETTISYRDAAGVPDSVTFTVSF
jgi:hypothetical protein